MRYLIIVMLTVSTAQAVDIECTKKKGFWYPTNAKAKQIAKMLRVSTCGGKKFREVIKGSGLSTNVTRKDKRMSVDEVLEKLRGKREIHTKK